MKGNIQERNSFSVTFAVKCLCEALNVKNMKNFIRVKKIISVSFAPNYLPQVPVVLGMKGHTQGRGPLPAVFVERDLFVKLV